MLFFIKFRQQMEIVEREKKFIVVNNGQWICINFVANQKYISLYMYKYIGTKLQSTKRV